jgi:predicted ester cyclase
MSAGPSMPMGRGTEPGTGYTPRSLEDENKTLVRRSLNDVWGRLDANAVDRYYAATFVDHSPNPGYSANRDGIKKLVGVYKKAFPNATLTIGDVLADGDQVAARFTFSGRNTGELQGMPPTHREVTALGLAICRVASGQIVESWEAVDQLQIMQQLGVMPTPGRQKQ